jgi:hypothetical protein
MWEADRLVRQWGSERGYDLVVRFRFGGAPCSFFDQMRADRQDRPYAVIVSFTGNPEYMSPCVGPHTVSSHAYQLKQVKDIWTGSRARLVWAATPRLPYDVSEQVQDAMRAEAQKQGMVVADAGRYVTPNRTWAQVLPCIAGESCVGHQINPAVPGGSNIVRANDGVHFCPGGPRGFDACPYFSAGAWRFAKALTEPLPTRR